MNVAVAGAIVFDETVFPDGRRVESFGGIIYNLGALSAIGDGELDIWPVSKVGSDKYDEVLGFVSSMNGVHPEGLRKIENGRLTHAQLIYRDDNYRDEVVRHMMPPFNVADFDSVLSCDALVVNFVNGTEMTLDTVAEIRSKTKAFMHLDMHNVMVRFLEDGEKKTLDFSEWPKWVACFDAVQMNEFEAQSVLTRELEAVNEFVDAAKEVLDAGPKIVLITLGPQGVVLAYRHNDGQAYYCHISCAPVLSLVDATGSGDAFSAGFVWNTLKGQDPITSAMAAATVAAVNCETPGIGPLAKARDASQRTSEIWPELSSKVAEGWLGNPY